MLIYLVDVCGNVVLRYKSDHVPRVNETVSMINPMKSWSVLTVTSLIDKQAFEPEEKFLKSITVIVEEKL